MLETLTYRLDGMTEGERYYNSVRDAKEHLSEYVVGTFSLFNHRHDAPQQERSFVEQVISDVEEIAASDPEAPERFRVIETGDGYAVWDDIRDEVYVDEEGVSEHFSSEWPAEDYLEQVKKAVSEKETAEWLYVEQSKNAAAEPETTEPAPLRPPVPRKKNHTAMAHPLNPSGSNYCITDDHIGEGAPLERFQRNLDAIRLLKTVEVEERTATAEEQAVLAQYVGWGGLADFFDEKNARHGELKELLTDAEYAAARESTLTAFYTPPVVIRSIYAALKQMGFQQGNILEPSCGVGNFLGMLPESMADSKLYGVELDDLSGRMARQLYQRSGIAVQGYEKTAFPDNFFDVAVGNVPFGQFKVADKRYDRLNLSIHEYFIAKTLDKVRPGGVIAFVI